jgi:hypothetical protein
MHTEIRVRAWVLVCAAVVAAVGAPAASAQPTDQAGAASAAPGTPSLSVTSFFEIGEVTAPGGGIAFSIPWTRTLSLEIEGSVGVDAARASLSMIWQFPKLGAVVPYAAGGVGLLREQARHFTDIGLDESTKMDPALNVGGGTMIPVNERWAVRADFRWYNPAHELHENWRAYGGVVFATRRH